MRQGLLVAQMESGVAAMSCPLWDALKTRCARLARISAGTSWSKRNAENSAPVVIDGHGPADMLRGVFAHQVADHLIAKSESLAVTGERHDAEVFEPSAVIVQDELITGHDVSGYRRGGLGSV